ncbi:MAG: hypothetical protein HOV79_29210 [Hamadaea sp.]|nr:hypothetical protein [Hamadaea sp.]
MTEPTPPYGDPYATPAHGAPRPEDPTAAYPVVGQPPYGQPTQAQPYPPYQQPPVTQPGYPQPGQPQHTQPQYAQPHYAQPGYGQPYSPQPYSPQPFAAQPPKKRTGLWIALSAVLLVLCLGGGVAAGVTILNTGDGEPTSSATGGPSTAASGSQSSPTASSAPAAAVKVVLPTRLLGQPRIDDSSLQTLADQMNEQLDQSTTGATSSVAGFYGKLGTKAMTMVVAAAAPIKNKTAFAAGMATGVKGSLNVGTLKDVPPGPLGGIAQCADARASGIDIAFCMWVDDGSYGIVAFYYKKVATVKDDFIDVRSQVEVPL